MADAENRIVGRGEVWFDQFLAGTTTPTGELYFGNTPELSLSISTESLEHYSSDHGLKELDASVDLSVDMGGSFQCDNISLDNLALWFLGDKSTAAVAAAATQTYALANVVPGRSYQVGMSDTIPEGVRAITVTALKKGATTLTLGTDYTKDEALGRITILDTGSVVDGDDLTVEYDQVAYTRDATVSGNNSLYGRLRFISDNPVGRNRDYFFPYVKLSADGDFSLKGDDWQNMGFNFKALKLINRQRVYITDRASTAS